LVVDARFEQYAGDLRHLGDFEGLEHDGVFALGSEVVFDFYRQLPALEGILIGPLHRVRWSVIVGLVQRAVDEETNGAENGAWRALDLRDDADGADAAGAAERGSDGNLGISIP